MGVAGLNPEKVNRTRVPGAALAGFVRNARFATEKATLAAADPLVASRAVILNRLDPGPGRRRVGAGSVAVKVPPAATGPETEAPVVVTVTVSSGVKSEPVTSIGAPTVGRALTKQAPLSVIEGAADASARPVAIVVSSTSYVMYQPNPIVRFPAGELKSPSLLPKPTVMRLGPHRLALALAVTVACALIHVAGAAAAGTFFIRGGGDGHGIGMSQYGADGYAEHGKSYQFMLGHYYQGTALGHTDPNQTVRVLLATGSAGFAGATRIAGVKLDPSTTYTVRPLPGSLLGVFGPDGKQVAKGAAPLTATGPGPLSVAGLGQYRGSLEFRPDGSGGVETVEAVGLDDYVRGVISKEVPASWPPQALDAQAVAARTYAITTDVAGADYNLYDDTRSQMYGGLGAETPATNAAVTATAGQVVTYKGAPVVTYFFNSSGGHTESIENVWPGAQPEPWLVGVPDPYDKSSGDPYYSWGSQMTVTAAQAKLGAYLKGGLVGIRITKHGVSPRILTAQVVGTRGTTTVTGIQLQQAFGLLTTLARFTAITSSPGTPRARLAVRMTSGARALSALARSPLLDGQVFPAAAGSSFTLEMQSNHRWRSIGHHRLGRDGRFTVKLPSAGTYRAVYAGLTGPAVAIP